MIKLIATDMDGTLLNSRKKVGTNFKEVVKELNERGVIFALASGRNFQRIKEKFDDMDLDLMYISDNGNYIEYKGEILNKNMLSKKDVLNLSDFLKKRNYCKASFSNENNIYTDDKYVYKIGRIFKYKSEFVKNLSDIDGDIIKCSVLVHSSMHSKLLAELKEAFPHLNISRSSKHTIDVNSGSMNKGKAIELLKNIYSLSEKEVMVFGDYLNDLEMMDTAYFSYAMKNAHKDLKKRANFEAPPNDKNGVLRVIKEVILDKNSSKC